MKRCKQKQEQKQKREQKQKQKHIIHKYRGKQSHSRRLVWNIFRRDRVMNFQYVVHQQPQRNSNELIKVYRVSAAQNPNESKDWI